MGLNDPGRTDMNAHRHTVLVADDYADSAQVLATALELLTPYDVKCVTGGQAAVDAAGDDLCACVLDVNMPGVDGIEVARRLRDRLGEDRPMLVAVTGHPDSKDRASLSGLFDYVLAKPVPIDSLVELLADC